jgi:class 3 adenylate cyclase/tetratricopeptide (TPR) repeat protein
MAFPGEIRPVTVLFARFSAADEDHAPLDPEQHLRLAQAFQASAQAAVDHYGGHIDSCIGDTVVAVFGTPVAHGNDAERALRAAVDIRDSVPALSEEQVRPVAAHVGVAAGQVVVSAEDADQGGYAMTGDSVDSARQLELKSRSGEVLATQVLLAGADRFFDSQPAPELNLRSRGRSLPVQRILAVRATPRRNRPTRFVGRRLELGQIQSVLDACRDPGHAHIVYVRGEPGIGKTRLLEETAIHAEAQGFACYRVLILDFGTSKNEEVQRALARGLLGLSPGAEPQQVEFVADLAVSENRTAVERRVFLNDLLDVPQPLALKSRFDAMDESVRNQGRTDVLTDLVHHRSTQVPVLIMIEDLHWADAPVIERLAVVASALRDQPVVLLMTSRVEGDPLDPSWRTTTREIPLVTIDLRPLTEVDAALMAGELSEEDEEIRRRCIERAQGNPLFLEQLLRATSEYDESDAIPSSVQELALSRSDRLETPDRDALRAASVLGQRFALDALHHLLQRPDYACTELVAHDLVRPDRGGFLFAHALIREGIYASLLSETRRALHLRAAEWFAGSDLALRANHLEAAGDSSAADAYLAAARQEFRAYRAERGLQLAQRGLQVGGEADCCRLHNLEGEIYYHVGPVSGSLKAFRAALESAPDEVDRCHALVGMAMGLRMVDDYDGAVAALDEAEPIAEAHELWDDLARICITRANLAFWKGHTDKCLPDGERALDYARRAKSVELEVHALGIIGDAHYAVGRMRSAHDHFERCVDAARRHGLGRVEVAHRCQTAGGTLQYMLDLRRSLDLSVEAVSLSAEIGSLRSEMQSNLSASNAAFFVGELALSRKHADGALELANQLGAVRTKARYRYYCARILVAEGKRREARKMLEEAYSISEETGAGYTGAAILGGLARVTEDPQQRSEVLSLGEALLAKGAVGHNFLEFYEDAMEASLENEEWKQALRYAALLEDYVGSEPLPLTDLLLARTRALVAFGQGKRDESLFRELRRLVEEAREHELMLVVPALEAALAQRHV